jgi:hypothetical protein
MMKRIVLASALLSLLVVPLSAKGPTTRIVIKHLTTGSVHEITEPAALEPFQVWAGKGTFSGAPGTTVEGTQGFIVDWAEGAVVRRPSPAQRYEVRFYVAPKRGTAPVPGGVSEELAYIVLYEHDPSTNTGFVYFPGRSDEHFRLNARTIHRGVEGSWLHASDAWLSAIAKLTVAR